MDRRLSHSPPRGAWSCLGSCVAHVAGVVCLAPGGGRLLAARFAPLPRLSLTLVVRGAARAGQGCRGLGLYEVWPVCHSFSPGGGCAGSLPVAFPWCPHVLGWRSMSGSLLLGGLGFVPLLRLRPPGWGRMLRRCSACSCPTAGWSRALRAVLVCGAACPPGVGIPGACWVPRVRASSCPQRPSLGRFLPDASTVLSLRLLLLGF